MVDIKPIFYILLYILAIPLVEIT